MRGSCVTTEEEGIAAVVSIYFTMGIALVAWGVEGIVGETEGIWSILYSLLLILFGVANLMSGVEEWLKHLRRNS